MTCYTSTINIMEININCDLGEKSKFHSIENDPDLLNIVNSANIACGYHAGDEDTMNMVIKISKSNGVSIGAHPSFNDPENFGRKRINLSSFEVTKLITNQYEILQKIAEKHNENVTHIKPHGALNNMACEDINLANTIAKTINDIDKNINLNVINYFYHLQKLIKEKSIEGITNLAPSYNKLIISFDLSITNFEKLKKILETLKIKKNNQQDSKEIKIPICFDEEFALDLISLSKKLAVSPNEIIELHLNKKYFCYMTGFIAGMPFLGDIDINIRTDRLQTPRVKVPKGSVGITEQFCNIYTFESPGGWNIVGNTPLKVFDKLNLNDPALIKPGDRVSFYKISKQEYINWND